MGRGVGTEVGGIQGGPLTAGARLTPAKPMGVSVLRYHALQQCPQCIRHAQVGRHLVHGCSLASLAHLYHALTLSNPRYPDRLLEAEKRFQSWASQRRTYDAY